MAGRPWPDHAVRSRSAGRHRPAALAVVHVDAGDAWTENPPWPGRGAATPSRAEESMSLAATNCSKGVVSRAHTRVSIEKPPSFLMRHRAKSTRHGATTASASSTNARTALTCRDTARHPPTTRQSSPASRTSAHHRPRLAHELAQEVRANRGLGVLQLIAERRQRHVGIPNTAAPVGAHSRSLGVGFSTMPGL